MKLSIVIPAYNEEARIGRMLDAYLPYFAEHFGRDVEFIVVVNGTTDATADHVRARELKFPNLRHIVEPAKIGKGGAIILGLKAALGDNVGFVDADGSTSPDAFHDLVLQLGSADGVIASRWCRGARVDPPQSFVRRLVSRGFNFFTRLLFGMPYHDTQCGAKLLTRPLLERILPNLGVTRWAFDVDLLFQARRAGMVVKEIPTVWHDVAGSKIQNVAQVSAEMFAALIRLRLLYSPFSWTVDLYNRYLGPFIHPPGMEHDHLFRHSLLLMAGSQVGNVGNLVFQMVMVRMLTRNEYGELAALLGVFMIFSVPLSAMGGTVAHFVASFLKEGQPGKVWGLLRRLCRDSAIAGLVVFAATQIWRDDAAGFLQIDNVTPVSIIGVALAVTLLRVVLGGGLQGAQSFVWFSVFAMLWSLLRLVLSPVLIALGGSVSGAVAGHTIAIVLCGILNALLLPRLLKFGVSESPGMAEVYAYFARFVVALAGLFVLMYADVVIVKHYFEPVLAGAFAKVAMVAKMIVFLPQPVTVAMFPKVVSSGKTSYESWRTLTKALVMVSSVVIAACIACSLVPGLVLIVLAGETTPETVRMLRALVWALCPVSILFVVMQFHLAQRQFLKTVPLLFCAAAYLVGAALYHETPMQVVAVLAIAATLALIVTCALLPWRTIRSTT